MRDRERGREEREWRRERGDRKIKKKSYEISCFHERLFHTKIPQNSIY